MKILSAASNLLVSEGHSFVLCNLFEEINLFHATLNNIILEKSFEFENFHFNLLFEKYFIGLTQKRVGKLATPLHIGDTSAHCDVAVANLAM